MTPDALPIRLCVAGAFAVVTMQVSAQESRPCSSGDRACQVASTRSHPAQAPRKTLADILREREGTLPRPATREPQPDGAAVLKERMGAY